MMYVFSLRQEYNGELNKYTIILCRISNILLYIYILFVNYNRVKLSFTKLVRLNYTRLRDDHKF